MPKKARRVAALKKTAAKGVRNLEKVGRELEAEAAAVGKKAARFAKKNPLAVAGAAAGIGALAGFIAGRRTGKKKKK